MKTSEMTNEIIAALAKAQGLVKNPSKDRKAEIKSDKGNYSYTYATLADGLEAIRESFSANALAVIQATRIERDVLMLDTRLSHASGQWIEAEYAVCKFPLEPRIIGAALTYARRYALFGLVGIAGEDDDGNGAKDLKVDAPRPAPALPDPVRKITVTEQQFIETALLNLPDTARVSVLKRSGVACIADIPASTFHKVADYLNAQLDKIHEGVGG